jgi:hypothetical protein
MYRYEGNTMPTSTEAQITEWIASQKQSMIDLLRDVVNIDSGSYDKHGVDAVGSRFQQHFAAHGIEAWREPHDVFGDAIHALVAKPGSNERPVFADGSSRHGVSQGRGGAPAVHHRGHPRPWAGGRRYEGRSGHHALSPRASTSSAVRHARSRC